MSDSGPHRRANRRFWFLQILIDRMAATRAKPKAPLDHAAEPQMQADFMQGNPAATPTLDDVVRFLRQRGDVVIRAGEGFTINSRLTLNAQELVRCANEKMAQLGQPPFPSDVWSVAPRLLAEAADPAMLTVAART